MWCGFLPEQGKIPIINLIAGMHLHVCFCFRAAAARKCSLLQSAALGKVFGAEMQSRIIATSR
jgi:hypothetical protein